MTHCWPICSSFWQVVKSSQVTSILVPSADVPREIFGVSRSRGGRTAHLKVRRMNSFVAFDFWTDPTDRTSNPMIVLKENWGPLTSNFLTDKCQLHISKLLRERQPCEYVNYPWESSKCFLGRWANKPSWNTYIRKCTGVQLQSTDFPHFQRKGESCLGKSFSHSFSY